MPCLIVAANLPDLDVLGPLLFGATLDFRRGWTHGPLGLLLLAPLLGLLLWGWDRRQARRGTRPLSRSPVRLPWLLGLAWLGALSHPLLDWLNTYGVRPLMPFSDRWFYGDTLFVIDVWLWALLLGGVLVARRRSANGSWAAVAALTVATGYVVVMAFAGRLAERAAAKDLAARGLGRPDLVLASPLPLNPLKRHIIYRSSGTYGFGDVDFAPAPRVSWLPDRAPEDMTHPAVARAAQRRHMAGYLAWSRMPYAEVWRDKGWTWVRLRDARYRRVPQEAGLIELARIPIE